MSRREMGSKRGSLPPKEGDLTCMFLAHLFNFFSRTTQWILMKLCRDEVHVLIVPYMHVL